MKDNLKGVGIWGQRHYQYLKENKPSAIGVMRMNGNLIPYLQSVDEQADKMVFQLVKQLTKQEGVTEELKRRDQMAWVGAMNNIRDRENEIVLSKHAADVISRGGSLKQRRISKRKTSTKS